MPRARVLTATLAVVLWAVPTARAERVTFTLLQLNDVYEIMPPKEGDLGGLDRVAALRKQLEATRGAGRVFAVLAGDCVSPSVMGDARIIKDGKLTDERLAGRQMLAVLNSLRLDYATFGNHEFDLKSGEFRACLEESPGIRWFSSNAWVARRALPRDIPQRVEFTIAGRSKGCSVKVGMFGLTLDFKTKPTRPDYANFDDFLEVASHEVERLQGDHCDVIVAVTHLKLEQDLELAEKVPGVHLIVGGHEHQRNYVGPPPASRRPPIAKADANARTVYVHDFAYDTEKGELAVSSSLRFVDDSLGSDPETRRAIVRWVEVAFDGLRREGEDDPEKGTKYKVVKLLQEAKKLPEPLTNRDLQAANLDVGVELEGREAFVRTDSTNLTRFLLKVMRRKAGDDVDLAILNSGSIRIDDVIPKAGLSVYDIFRILPYEVKVHRVNMKGRLIRDLLSAGRGDRVRTEGSFLQADNYDFAGGRLVDTKQPIVDDRVYKVAIAHYLLTGQEKDLESVLPGRDLAVLSRLTADKDGIELDKEPPFDLLEALAEKLAEVDRKGKTPEEVAKLEAIEPTGTPFAAIDAANKGAQEAAMIATFSVPTKPCKEAEDVPAPPLANDPRAIDRHVDRIVDSLDHVGRAVGKTVDSLEHVGQAVGKAETAKKQSAPSEDGQMDWIAVLAIFTIAGLLGGSLATLRLVDLTTLFEPPSPIIPPGPVTVPGPTAPTGPTPAPAPGVPPSPDLSKSWPWRKWLPVIIYNAASGIGGAFAALFFMVLDQKIKIPLGPVEKVNYATTGFVAGFLGMPLLNLAAALLMNTARSALDALVKKQVEGVKEDLDKQVEGVQQHVDAEIRRGDERSGTRMNKMADAVAWASTSLGDPAVVAAGTAGAMVESVTVPGTGAADRQARAELMSAIIRGRLAMSEDISDPEISALMAELEKGLKIFPDRREAFIVLGQLHKKRGDYAKGIEVLKQGLAEMAKTGAADPIDVADTHYNLACYYCLMYASEADPVKRAGLRAHVIEDLREAVKRPENIKEAAEDPDFVALRDNPEFRSLVPPPHGPVVA